MSDFQMPNIPDDDIHPLKPDLKWFFSMLFIIIGIVIFTFLLFNGFSRLIIGNLSIEEEKKYFGNVEMLGKEKPFDFKNISYKIKLPKDIDVFIVENNQINAFASIGSKVIFTSEILKNFQNEEEFLFVLGHEIGHINSRDPIKSFSINMPYYISLLFMGIDLGVDFNQVYNISSSYMSRQTELNADKSGIEFVIKNGGNPNCIIPFFDNFDNKFQKYLSFSSTHPTNKLRIEQIKNSNKNNEKDCKKWNNRK